MAKIKVIGESIKRFKCEANDNVIFATFNDGKLEDFAFGDEIEDESLIIDASDLFKAIEGCGYSVKKKRGT